MPGRLRRALRGMGSPAGGLCQYPVKPHECVLLAVFAARCRRQFNPGATLGVEWSGSGLCKRIRLSSWRVFLAGVWEEGKSDSRRTFPLVLRPFFGVALLPVDGRPRLAVLPPATADFRPLAMVIIDQLEDPLRVPKLLLWLRIYAIESASEKMSVLLPMQSRDGMRGGSAFESRVLLTYGGATAETAMAELNVAITYGGELDMRKYAG